LSLLRRRQPTSAILDVLNDIEERLQLDSDNNNSDRVTEMIMERERDSEAKGTYDFDLSSSSSYFLQCFSVVHNFLFVDDQFRS